MLPSSVCSNKINVYKIAKNTRLPANQIHKMLIKLNDIIIQLYGPLFEDTGEDNTPETKDYCGVK